MRRGVLTSQVQPWVSMIHYPGIWLSGPLAFWVSRFFLGGPISPLGVQLSRPLDGAMGVLVAGCSGVEVLRTGPLTDPCGPRRPWVSWLLLVAFSLFWVSMRHYPGIWLSGPFRHWVSIQHFLDKTGGYRLILFQCPTHFRRRRFPGKPSSLPAIFAAGGSIREVDF